MHYHAGRYGEAKDAFHGVASAKANSHDGFLLLAMAQGAAGESDAALVNFDTAARALAGGIATRLRSNNSADAPIIKTRIIGTGRWMDVAILGAFALCAEDGITDLALPTGESAEREEETEAHGGLYFTDDRKWLIRRRRVFYPNFFATFCEMLLADPAEAYYTISAGRARALLQLGRNDEAADFRAEAEGFRRY